jgi:hypothetical protein
MLYSLDLLTGIWMLQWPPLGPGAPARCCCACTGACVKTCSCCSMLSALHSELPNSVSVRSERFTYLDTAAVTIRFAACLCYLQANPVCVQLSAAEHVTSMLSMVPYSTPACTTAAVTPPA